MEITENAGPSRAELIAALNAKLFREQNLPLAILAAAATSLAGAGIWMGITVATQLHIGYVALAVGAAVGYAVRYAGKGVTKIYGVIGAVFTLLSCLAGEVFAVIQMAASSHNLGFFDALPHVDFSILVPTVLEHMSLLDYVIYGIGVYEGYQFSFRKLTPQEIQEAGLASTPTTS